MADLTGLRDMLREGLSCAQTEDGPSVSELAERIKTLKAGQVVEVTATADSRRPNGRGAGDGAHSQTAGAAG